MPISSLIRSRRPLVLSALACLAACSGGGGSGGSTLPPVNQAPVFTSSSSVSLTENSAGTVYTAAATDPDGDALTFALIAGGDEGVFTFNAATGVLSLATALDFETPQDANRDNVYSVTLEVRDSRGGSTRLVIAITVTNQAESMALRRVGTGFVEPLYVTGVPGTDRLLVLQKAGRARLLNPATGVIDSVDFLDLTGQISIDSERGLLGLAFSPGFATDRTFYINVTNTAGNTEIRRYRMFTGSSTQADPSTADVILTIAQPFSNHKAGWIGFSNDGLLLVPTGDGGSAGDPNNNAQNPNSLLGKILRLDVSGDDFPGDPNRDYRIPPGNAFPGGTAGAPEIFALGLRNPFRASVDAATGDLFIGDVGQNAIEEVNRMRPGDAGANYGWRLREGTQPYNGGADSASFTRPVTEYGHGTGPAQGRSVTGGYVYRGNIEPIRNQYVFGDFVSGNVWAVPVTSLVPGQTVPSSAYTRLNPLLVPDAGTLSLVSSFGTDLQGRLYIVAFSGSVFRIDGAP